MEKMIILKALADETRMNILRLLLKHNYCVRALAKELDLSESTTSQHLKALREAGLVSGEKRGYFVHYDVECSALRELAAEIAAMSDLPRASCPPGISRCKFARQETCRSKNCTDEAVALCHGRMREGENDANCECRCC